MDWREWDNPEKYTQMDVAEIAGDYARLLKDKNETLRAIGIILNLHYIEGDMTPKEALDEICHLIYPESRPTSEGDPP